MTVMSRQMHVGEGAEGGGTDFLQSGMNMHVISLRLAVWGLGVGKYIIFYSQPHE